MYGQVHVIVRSLVIDKFGAEKWAAILECSGLDDTDDFKVFHRYSDALSIKLVAAVSTTLGAPLETVLEIFGEYFLFYCYSHGYDKMLKTLGSDFVSFMSNLDSLHSLLSMTYPNFEAPSFRVEEKPGGVVRLHYYSIREGLHHIVTGLLRAVGRDLFDQKVSSTIVAVDELDLPGGKTQHHAEFDVQLEAKEPRGKGEDIELVLSTDDALIFPPEKFCELFPFHVVFTPDLVITQVGNEVERISGGTVIPGATLESSFELLHPLMSLTYENIINFINSVYIMRTIAPENVEKLVRGAGIVLKGQIVYLEDTNQLIFIGSPRLADLNELLDRNVYLSDIPLYDVTRELVLLNQQRVAEIEVSKQLDETTAELKKLGKALEKEKEKTDSLLYQMLPEKVAKSLRDGEKCEAEKFDNVTILFSDIVSFTTIAAAVTPIDIVNMLNELYNHFDTLSNKHDVYKVETIGDAYMVVCGVPEPTERHARAVASQGLDMILMAAKVMSPATGKPLQIRVGMHTGQIVAGVVGLKMPRYCLFGETVNTASRMESNGIAGLLHISPDTYKFLKDEPTFKLTCRGNVTIKGKGVMETWFVWSNGESEIPYQEVPPQEEPVAVAVKPTTDSKNKKSKACSVV